MLAALTILFLIAAVAAIYTMILRPLLRRWSVLKAFWSATDEFELSAWGKIVALLDGLKIKILARLMWVPALFVEAYDWIGPYLAGADFSPLTANLPSWAPIAIQILGAVAIPMLIDWARTHSTSPQPPGA